jgi:peptidoglycan/LPS O-acetylase OafA/YrhL
MRNGFGETELEASSSRRALVEAPAEGDAGAVDADAGADVNVDVALDAETGWKLLYRPEIDGLRFWAVMPVIFYHYNALFHFNGGYAGVDVFFVISGYLITTIVIRDLCCGKPVLRVFWERRVRRLFPAIAVMLISFYIYGWFMLASSVYNNFVGESIYGLTASSNIYYYITTKDRGGYGAAGAINYPLLHFWSLAVEEQFYLFLPLVLVCVWKYCEIDTRRWHVTLSLLGLVLVSSFIFSVVYTPINSPFCFYLLFARAWELAVGSFVGLGTSLQGSKVAKRWVQKILGIQIRLSPLVKRLLLEAVSWLGFGLILFVYFFFTKAMEHKYPYFYALGPCAGAAMVIVGNTPMYDEMDTALGKTDKQPRRRVFTTCGWFLSMQPFVWIGKISYSLYLWHWPLWCFKSSLGFSQSSVVSSLMLTLIAVALSAFSTECLEQPFRSSNQVGKRAMWTVSAAVWTALLSFSIAVNVTKVGGKNSVVNVPIASSGQNNLESSLSYSLWEPPLAFFMENAYPSAFSMAGIDASPIWEEGVPAFESFALPSAIKLDSICPTDTDGTGECEGAEGAIAYNSQKDPPCIAFVGDSHMNMHKHTLAKLAKEYNVTILWLGRPGRTFFNEPLNDWDKQRIRILEDVQPKRVVFQFFNQGTVDDPQKYTASFDALAAGNPEKVLIVGDNPKLEKEGTLFPEGHQFLKNQIRVGMDEGRWDNSTVPFDFLTRVKPKAWERFLHVEDVVQSTIEENYKEKFHFKSTYPAFMDSNNIHVQVVGAETINGNRLIYRDDDHLNAYGSLRLQELFRNHIFIDLEC